jgi:hypothetical protein
VVHVDEMGVAGDWRGDDSRHWLLEPIGYVPLAEYEEAYYRRLQALEESGTVAPTGLR